MIPISGVDIMLFLFAIKIINKLSEFPIPFVKNCIIFCRKLWHCTTDWTGIYCFSKLHLMISECGVNLCYLYSVPCAPTNPKSKCMGERKIKLSR